MSQFRFSDDTSSDLFPDAQATLEAIRERASKDRAFRDLCLSDPAAAVEEATGIDVPADFEVQFVEQREANLTVILPDPLFNDADDDLIGGDDLDLAAGGTAGDPEPPW